MLFIRDYYVRPWMVALAGIVAVAAVAVGGFFAYPAVSERVATTLDQWATDGVETAQDPVALPSNNPIADVVAGETVTVDPVGELPISPTGTWQEAGPGFPKMPKGTAFVYIWDSRPFRDLTETYKIQYELLGWSVSSVTFDAASNTAQLIVWNDSWQGGIVFSDAEPGSGPVGVLQGMFYPLNFAGTPAWIADFVADPGPEFAESQTPAPQNQPSSPAASTTSPVPAQSGPAPAVLPSASP